MKPQKRPFVVELKRTKRATGKVTPSIWASVDLKAIAAQALDEGDTAAPVEGSANGAIAKRQPRILPALSETPSPTSKPPAVTEPEPAAAVQEDAPGPAVGTPKAEKRQRRRDRLADDLPRGERWKRRLPKILRHR